LGGYAPLILYEGLFKVGVPKQGKGTLGLLWDYFLQITFTWKKFKWEKLNNPIQNDSYDGEFSHLDIIVYQYFGYSQKT
jgi:hypothetical protein